MYARSVPLPTPDDLATERLLAAVESAIGGLRNLAADGQNAKCPTSSDSPSFATNCKGERPRTIIARWVDDPRDIGNTHNHDNFHQ